MNFKCRKILVAFSLFAVFFTQSCSDDPEPIKSGADGFFIVNEGGFGNGNTSVSFYDRATDQVTNNVFAARNGRSLGDQTQSMAVFEGKGYILVQGSGKIEVIDADDYSSLATISEGIESPRYFVGISSAKAYVSDWGADGLTGTVKVIDLTTNTLTKTIPTGKGANRMLLVGNLLYVTNAGGYDKDNTVKVIDTGSDAIITTITVGDNPNSIQRDNLGNIWIASSGAVAYNDDWTIDEANSTEGTISKVSSSSAEVFRLSVDDVIYGGPGNLSASPDGKTLYYTYNGAVYAMNSTATTLPTTPIISKNYYGFSVDPFNGNLVGTVAPNFSSAGSIDILDASGNILDTYTAGIAPNGVAFK